MQYNKDVMNIEKEPAKSSIKRIGGYLYKVVPIIGNTGQVIQQAITPLMVELKPRDIMQIILGASILAIPVGFTEEVWKLGEQLPLQNVLLLTGISLAFLGTFVYFNFYRYNMKGHLWEYIKRVCAIYFLSLLVVGILLTIIQACPWGTNRLIAIKRIILVAFPSSMGAAISDMLK